MFFKLLKYIIDKNLHKTKYKLFIKETYRKYAINDLPLKHELVNVKKGRKRYDLLYFITPKGKYKFHLSRLLTFNSKPRTIIEGTLIT